MNNFSKPISKGDHVVVSMKENQFYFKLALDHLVCMMKLNYFLKDNTFDRKGGELEVKRIIEKTLSMNAAEEQEEISKESESGRFQSAIELSSISSSSLPADDGEMSHFSHGHAMDVFFYVMMKKKMVFMSWQRVKRHKKENTRQLQPREKESLYLNKAYT